MHVLQMAIEVLLADEPLVAVRALPVSTAIVGFVQLVIVIHIKLWLKWATGR